MRLLAFHSEIQTASLDAYLPLDIYPTGFFYFLLDIYIYINSWMHIFLGEDMLPTVFPPVMGK